MIRRFLNEIKEIWATPIYLPRDTPDICLTLPSVFFLKWQQRKINNASI